MDRRIHKKVDTTGMTREGVYVYVRVRARRGRRGT